MQKKRSWKSQTPYVDILAKMLINKNEVKASEGEEEDVELVDDVQYNEIAVVPSQTENDCRKTSARHYRLLPKD